jgi:hypothetical protein
MAEVGFPAREEILLYSTTSRPALEPAQPPIEYVLGALSRRLKRPERDTDHSPPCSAETIQHCTLVIMMDMGI